jgi:hypothetical protein
VIAKQLPVQATTTEDIRAYVPVAELHFQGRSSGFDLYCIPAPSGLRPDSYDPARAFLVELVSYFTARFNCDHESFIQMSQARDQATTHLFSDHARKWMPEMGLGVWTNRAPPRMWKAEDLEDMDPASGMPTLLHSLFRVTADANAKLDAMATMTGTGCGLQLISRVESTVLIHDLKVLFLGYIQDRVFRIFPWYVPLIESGALAEPMEPFTASALRGISLYIRESPEDGGILIVSAQPLAEIIAQLGCKQLEREMKPTWTLAE